MIMMLPSMMCTSCVLTGSLTGGAPKGSGAKVEPGGLKGALNPAVLHIAVGQGGIPVGTPVVDGEDLARLSVENGDWQSSIEP